MTGDYVHSLRSQSLSQNSEGLCCFFPTLLQQLSCADDCAHCPQTLASVLACRRHTPGAWSTHPTCRKKVKNAPHPPHFHTHTHGLSKHLLQSSTTTALIVPATLVAYGKIGDFFHKIVFAVAFEWMEELRGT